jgi:transketolase
MADARHLRARVIELAAASGEGHIGSALSILDVLRVLYAGVLRIDPAKPDDPQRDRFVLSKGHGSLGLYVALADAGFFPSEALDDFCTYDSRFGGHPDCNKVPGVEASTGSLAHGAPMSVGLALGLRIRKSDARVFCMIGDGEANEGAIWEATLLGAHHRLDNLSFIIDYNHSTDRALGLGDLVDKFTAFGWATTEVDGHDEAALRAVLSERSSGRPSCIVCRTIKGYGCRTMENDPSWHHRSPTASELPQLLSDLR